MPKLDDLWTYEDCAAATGYAFNSLRNYYRLGEFIEPARVIGKAYLFDPKTVLAWKRDHIRNRAVTGAKSPPDPVPARNRAARKRNV